MYVKDRLDSSFGVIGTRLLEIADLHGEHAAFETDNCITINMNLFDHLIPGVTSETHTRGVVLRPIRPVRIGIEILQEVLSAA